MLLHQNQKGTALKVKATCLINPMRRKISAFNGQQYVRMELPLFEDCVRLIFPILWKIQHGNLDMRLSPLCESIKFYLRPETIRKMKASG